MDIAGAIADLLREIIKPISLHCGYLTNAETNIKNMNRKIGHLKAQKNDIETILKTARAQNEKEPTSEVQHWQTSVDEAANEASTIDAEFQKKQRCLFRSLPNYCSRMKLSKQAVRNIKLVEELINKHLGGLLIEPAPSGVITIPTEVIVGKTTAAKILEEIWECLMDPHIGRIGVHGMGGVGKTTMMMNINNRLKAIQYFDNVIWVTVSKGLDIRKIQNNIATAVKLDISNYEDEVTRAAALYEKLGRRKQFVIILDDMWETFSLEKVGIPKPDIKNGCKMVVTTRQLEVCRGMECQKIIKLDVLSREEAWDLFKEKVGDNIFHSAEIEETARLVVEKCAGLPLAIITIARAMLGADNIRLWRNALNELRASAAQFRGMQNEVFASLKFSYDHLRNDMIQNCFLYCALYPEDYEILATELIRYWSAEGLLGETGETRAEIDKGQAILNELKNACMLESCSGISNEEYVKMHDLIREMAIELTKARFLIKTSARSTEWPRDAESSEDVERVSLMRNNIEMLSGEPKCSKLSTLFLNENPLSQNISGSFFKHMHNLRVLDISFTHIESLPDSLSELEKLHALLLRSCWRLSQVPSLSKLKLLRVLDLSSTSITNLPHGIEELIKLKRLNLSFTGNLKAFRAKVLTELSHLEDFEMYQSGWAWSSSSLDVDQSHIQEIMSLKRVLNLSIRFSGLPDLHIYIKSRRWQKLESFHLAVGLHDHKHFNLFHARYSVGIQGCDLISQANSILLPDNTMYLLVTRCTIARLSALSCFLKAKELKECTIDHCDGMKCILKASENPFPTLEILKLQWLSSLQTLCESNISSSTLASLKRLYISRCGILKHLLSIELLQSVQNLEEITVISCRQMVQIMGGGHQENDIIPGMAEEELQEGERMIEMVEEIEQAEESNARYSSTIILPKLKSLELSSLPELESICGQRILNCSSLQSIEIVECPKVRKLPLSVECMPAGLKMIKGERKWWDALLWDDPRVKTELEHKFIEIRSTNLSL